MRKLADADALSAWAAGNPGDLALFLRLAGDLGLERIGAGAERFLSFGAYGLLPAGSCGGDLAVDPLDTGKIVEDVSHAWLAGDAPLAPAVGETLVAADKPAAYTWCKAPRYGG